MPTLDSIDHMALHLFQVRGQEGWTPMELAAKLDISLASARTTVRYLEMDGLIRHHYGAVYVFVQEPKVVVAEAEDDNYCWCGSGRRTMYPLDGCKICYG